MNENYHAVGLDRAGNIKAHSAGDKDFCDRCAKYYRGLTENGIKRFHSARVLTDEELEKLQEKINIQRKRNKY